MPRVYNRRWFAQRTHAFIFLFIAVTLSSSALADDRETARRFYDRLTGVIPPDSAVARMQQQIAEGKPRDAALTAIDTTEFYNVGLKNFFTPWTNETQSADAPLNDYSATLIGAVRDEISFDRVLYDDILYTTSYPGVPAYANNNNAHYNQFEQTSASFRTYLEQQSQSALTGRQETPGIMGSRQFGSQFFSMGTNRRAVRFTFINFLCVDMENVADTTRPGHRIRRDVDRKPGGNSEEFRTKCKGCHAGLDGLAGAFAYYDFTNGAVVHTPGTVQAKFLQNGTTFPQGFVTQDDSWVNLWIEGVNKKMGWNGEDEGTGPEAYGEMLAKTSAFPDCMAKRVFTHVCLREPVTDEDKGKVNQLSANFSNNNFNMKALFADTAVSCLMD